MTYRGRVKNGVIVLEGSPSLPEGAEVRVEPIEADAEEPCWAEVFRDVIGRAQGLPPDASRNHDHYLYGASKR